MFLSTALLASFAFPAAPIAEPTLTWHQGTIETALSESSERDTLTALYFWRNGSEYCTEFYQNTLGDEKVINAIGEFVLFSAQHGTDAGNALFDKYNVTSLPTILFVTGNGEAEDAIAGFANAYTVINELDRITKGELTMSDLKSKVAGAEAGSEEHLEFLLKQSIKFGDLGSEDSQLATLKAIKKLDKRGKTQPGCTALMNLALDEISNTQGGDEAFEEWDLKSVRKLAKKVKNENGRFDIWNKIANLEAGRQRIDMACKAWMSAEESLPEDRARAWGFDIANYLMHVDGERTSVEKKFVLSIATRSNELAAAMQPEECECETGAEAKTDSYGKEECEHGAPTKMQAMYLATLARAYKLNGDAKLASITASRSITLDSSDENKEHLSELL